MPTVIKIASTAAANFANRIRSWSTTKTTLSSPKPWPNRQARRAIRFARWSDSRRSSGTWTRHRECVPCRTGIPSSHLPPSVLRMLRVFTSAASTLSTGVPHAIGFQCKCPGPPAQACAANFRGHGQCGSAVRLKLRWGFVPDVSQLPFVCSTRLSTTSDLPEFGNSSIDPVSVLPEYPPELAPTA